MKELLLSSLSPEELQSVLDRHLPASRRGADEVVEDAADACRALLAAAQEHTDSLQAENERLQKKGADASSEQVAAAEKQVSVEWPGFEQTRPTALYGLYGSVVRMLFFLVAARSPSPPASTERFHRLWAVAAGGGPDALRGVHREAKCQ